MGQDTDLKSGRNECFGDLEGMFGIESDSYSAGAGEFSHCIHPDDVNMAFQAIENTRQNKQSYFAEFRIPGRDGTVRWMIAKGQVHSNRQVKQHACLVWLSTLPTVSWPINKSERVNSGFV